MKKLIVLLFLITAFCAVPQEKKCPEMPTAHTVVIRDGKTGKEMVLPKEQFDSVFRLAQTYLALKDSVKNATVQKNVKVARKNEDLYEVTIKLNEEMSITVQVEVNNEELNKLRAKMKRLTTESPTVQIKELENGKRFEITMVIDDVRWTSVIAPKLIEGFDVKSFVYGAGAGAGGVLLLSFLKSLVIFL